MKRLRWSRPPAFGAWGLALILAISFPASPLVAHETRPGLLEITETGPETYSLLWKRPSGGEVEIRIAPVVPESCRFAAPDRQQLFVRDTMHPGWFARKELGKTFDICRR